MKKVFAAIIAAFQEWYDRIFTSSHFVETVGRNFHKVRQTIDTEVETLTNDVSSKYETVQARIDAFDEVVMAELAKIREAIRHLDATKRDGAGLRGEKPELLKGNHV